MSDNNNSNRRVSTAEIAAALAIGVGVAYGAYELFQPMFVPPEPEPIQWNIENLGICK